MKKSIFLFILLIIGSFFSIAQDINLKFSAHETDYNTSINIDSIKIINRTQSRELVVYQVDVNLSRCQANSISSLYQEDFTTKVYPNPFKNQLYIELNIGKKDLYIVTVFDAKGSISSSFKEELLSGNFRLKFINNRTGTYFISIQNSNYTMSHRVVCEQAGSSVSKIVLESCDKANQNVAPLKVSKASSFCIALGDGLECISYCGSCTDTLKFNLSQSGKTYDFEYKGFFPVIKTLSPASISYKKARCSGQITSTGCKPFKNIGLCISKTENPTISSQVYYRIDNQNQFQIDISNLESGTNYYARAFIEDASGVYYGENISFKTCNYPNVNTLSAENIKYKSSKCGAQVSGTECAGITSKGICWSVAENPTISSNVVYNQGTDATFYADLQNLEAAQKYYVRAFTVVEDTIIYGENIIFNTCNYPSVNTLDANNIKYTSVKSGGKIMGLDCVGYSSKGICWSKSQTPTIADYVIHDQGDSETFYADIQGLKAGETYYTRAFTSSNNEIFYGETKTFKTHNYPNISTANADSVKVYTAKLGGDVTGENGIEISAKGICWSKQQNPTINNFKIAFDGSIGPFAKKINNIDAYSSYYARAYVQIGDSVIYGNEVSFTTQNVLDIINFSRDSITNHKASLTYKINKNTDVNIISNGICYSKLNIPDYENDKVLKQYQDLSLYNDTLFPLYSSSEYHARAFAITDKDTIFSNDLIFNTTKTTSSFADLGMITGAVYDSLANKVYLIGDGKNTDCSPTMQQIAVAFDWAYADKDYYNYISIDPISDNVDEAWMKVRTNDAALDTDFGWIMFEADRLMKNYSLGRDNITKSKIYSNIPGYKNTFEIQDSLGTSSDPNIWSRFWLSPKSSNADLSKDGIVINDAAIKVQTQAMVWDNVKDSLVPAQGVVDDVSEAFANFMTNNYNEFANEKPVFRKLEQNLRLLMIAEWIREYNIPVNPDWIATESGSTYFVPRFTSSLTVIDKKLETNQLVKRTLFGGADLGCTVANTSNVQNISALKDAVAKPAISETSLGTIFSKNNHPVTFFETSNSNSFEYSALEQTFMTCLYKSTKAISMGQRYNYNIVLPGLEDRQMFPMTPQLFSYDVRPVSSGPLYYTVDGADVFIKDMSLVVDGTKTVHFSKNSFVSYVGDDFVTAYADDPNEEWYLESQGTGTSVYYWIAINSNTSRKIIFNPDYTNCLSDIDRGTTLQYTLYTNGLIKRIDNPSHSEYIEFILGSNKTRYIGYTSSSGLTKYFDPADQSSGSNVEIPVQIDGKGNCSINLDKNSFDWTFSSNPQTFGSSEISFLQQNIKGIRQALEKQEISPFFDGGRSVLVSNSGIVKIELPFEDFDNSSKKFLPENTQIKGIERFDNKKLLFYQELSGNKFAYEYADRLNYEPYSGIAAETKCFTSEADRVKNNSSSEKSYAVASVIDGNYNAQIGNNKIVIPVGNMEQPENKQKISQIFQGINEITIKRMFTDQMHQQSSAGTMADPYNQYQLYKPYCPNIKITSDYKISKKHEIRYNKIKVSNSGSIAVWSDPSFIDHNINAEIQTAFTNAGIKIDPDITSILSSDIIIINTELNNQVMNTLKDSADWLKNKILVINNCENGQSKLVDNSKLLQDYDLTAIIAYTDTQNAPALSIVLKELASIVGNLPSPAPFHELWKQAIDQAVNDPANASAIESIEKLRNSYIQHS